MVLRNHHLLKAIKHRWLCTTFEICHKVTYTYTRKEVACNLKMMGIGKPVKIYCPAKPLPLLFLLLLPPHYCSVLYFFPRFAAWSNRDGVETSLDGDRQVPVTHILPGNDNSKFGHSHVQPTHLWSESGNRLRKNEEALKLNISKRRLNDTEATLWSY